MSMSLRPIMFALLLCCFLVAGGVSVEAAMLSDTADSSATDAHEMNISRSQAEQPIASNTTITIQIRSDGDARWTIMETFNFSTDAEREGFSETAAAFESGEASGSDLGLSSFRRALELVNQTTERPMNITELKRSSTASESTGTLSLSFTWTNFARIDNGTIRIDDVLVTRTGPWFPGLTENQQLVIRAPEDFGIDNANVPPRNGELRWTGPVTFTNETLQSSFVGEGNSPVVTPTPSPTSTPPPDPEESSNLLPGIVGGTIVLFVLALLIMRRDELGDAFGTETQSDNSVDTTDTTESTPQPDSEPADDAEPDESEEDIELLSDEERVERLLEQNGGRMKQANIVTETDWSNAKVSQLLSSMDESDRINKLRIGRENLISLPDEDVTDFDYDDR